MYLLYSGNTPEVHDYPPKRKTRRISNQQNLLTKFKETCMQNINEGMEMDEDTENQVSFRDCKCLLAFTGLNVCFSLIYLFQKFRYFYKINLTTGIFCIDCGLCFWCWDTMTKWLPSDLFDYLPMQLELH